MTKTPILLALVALMGLSACNTAGGLVRDTYGATRFVVDQITEDDD